MSRDERFRELDAYVRMVSILRAQDPITNDKRKLLEELAGVLHASVEKYHAEMLRAVNDDTQDPITNDKRKLLEEQTGVLHASIERYHAEKLRAVNDDKLTTVANKLSGPNTGTDWATEGRQIIPLLPRLRGRTAFTTLANNLSLVTAIDNKQQPRIEERSEDSRLRMETDSDVQQIFSSEEESYGSSSREPEFNFNDRKRKRSLTESSDIEGSMSSKAREKQKTGSPVKATEVSARRISITLPSSTVHPITSDVEESESQSAQTNSGEESREPEINFNDRKRKRLFAESSDIEGSMSSKAGEKQKTGSPVKATEVSARRITVTLPSSTVHPITSDVEESESQSAQTNSDEGSKLVPVTNHVHKIDVPRSEDASTSRPCVKKIEGDPVKQAISNIVTRLMSERPESTTSNASGPPVVKSSPANLSCKTLSPVKANNHPPVEMTPRISKATTINSQPNARFGSKRNCIAVQKGMKEVELSHGGYEVMHHDARSEKFNRRLQNLDKACRCKLNSPPAKKELRWKNLHKKIRDRENRRKALENPRNPEYKNKILSNAVVMERFGNKFFKRATIPRSLEDKNQDDVWDLRKPMRDVALIYPNLFQRNIPNERDSKFESPRGDDLDDKYRNVNTRERKFRRSARMESDDADDKDKNVNTRERKVRRPQCRESDDLDEKDNNVNKRERKVRGEELRESDESPESEEITPEISSNLLNLKPKIISNERIEISETKKLLEGVKKNLKMKVETSSKSPKRQKKII